MSVTMDSANAMSRYKIQDIRSLVGHKTDLDMVKRRPAVRLEKGDD
jgi:phenylalanyl-tRNA synthetase alpha chain